MSIANKTILITGANRGVGRALLDEALKRGAKRIYAGTRGALQIVDDRVTPLTLDITDAAQIQRAVGEVDSLDVLINNAGIAAYDDLGNSKVIHQQLAVNLFGPLNVTRAFLPLLKRSKGAIVNNLSAVALAPLPFTPAYYIQGGRAQHDAGAQDVPGWRRRERSRGNPGPDRYRHEPRAWSPAKTLKPWPDDGVIEASCWRI